MPQDAENQVADAVRCCVDGGGGLGLRLGLCGERRPWPAKPGHGWSARPRRPPAAAHQIGRARHGRQSVRADRPRRRSQPASPAAGQPASQRVRPSPRLQTLSTGANVQDGIVQVQPDCVGRTRRQHRLPRRARRRPSMPSLATTSHAGPDNTIRWQPTSGTGRATPPASAAPRADHHAGPAARQFAAISRRGRSCSRRPSRSASIIRRWSTRPI